MTCTDRIIEHDNVNGIGLVLSIDTRSGSPNSRLFTISYKNKENKRSWPKASLFMAILLNILALFYTRISFTAISVIFIVLSFLLFFWVTHSVQSESLLVIPTVGIQSSVKYVYGREDNFIPWSSVDDVVINEVIKLHRVLYYLTVLVKPNTQNSEHSEPIKLIPLFKYTKPRLVMLEVIYSELQALLTETRDTVAKGSGDQG
ncbi:phosphatidylinositol N-acetylglucosaminyltransferase subunit H-like [Plodia interpunctella]|uniref:phosphatidylinositol N-acetylglucosaminyltransferase subunit H-like n=1 Tax=Plodia interpunctella TaxID=58824 RepID=UPI002368D278|nr:phosphatidylinositol N-acetylglucosaminyltransferase subunit H-like [Plodia interpunctella]